MQIDQRLQSQVHDKQIYKAHKAAHSMSRNNKVSGEEEAPYVILHKTSLIMST